jgi:hypothetical protein
MFLLLVIALVARPVTSKNGHAPWGIPVYTKVDTTNVRAVSAQQSSFVWEGKIRVGDKRAAYPAIAGAVAPLSCLVSSCGRFTHLSSTPRKV